MRKERVGELLAGGVSITSVADVENTFAGIVVKMFAFFWIIAVGMILWSAYTYLTAGGSEDKLDQAKKILLYAVIAAAVALLANGIGYIVPNILNGQ